MIENEEQKTIDRRAEILRVIHSTLTQKSGETYLKAIETMRTKANVDGPWQSKQPDEMIKIEVQAGTLQQQAINLQRRADEIKALLSGYQTTHYVVQLGSVLIWEMLDPEHSEAIEETVIITPSGGGLVEKFRLLSEKAPLTKVLIGKKTGETIKFGDITVRIKEII